MAGEQNRKRQRNNPNRRRHDRNKFQKTTNATQNRKDLGNGLQGILFSCTPHHENQAYREAVIMLGKYIEDTPEAPPQTPAAAQINLAAVAAAPDAMLHTAPTPVESGTKSAESETKPASDETKPAPDETKPAPDETKPALDETKASEHKPKLSVPSVPSVPSTLSRSLHVCSSGGADVAQALQAELRELRNPAQKLFTRVDAGVNGSVFVRISRVGVDLERVVADALREARRSRSPNARHCIRIMPVYNTCYAKPEDAARAAVEVVREHFPTVTEREGVSYAISFKARMNTGARREEFITEIAKAIDGVEPRYKVDLTKPDVTLIVEVLKTSCCIGAFREFYQLAKMNLREAACPSVKKNGVGAEKEGGRAKVTEVSADPATGESKAGSTGDEKNEDATVEKGILETRANPAMCSAPVLETPSTMMAAADKVIGEAGVVLAAMQESADVEKAASADTQADEKPDVPDEASSMS